MKKSLHRILIFCVLVWGGFVSAVVTIKLPTLRQKIDRALEVEGLGDFNIRTDIVSRLIELNSLVQIKPAEKQWSLKYLIRKCKKTYCKDRCALLKPEALQTSRIIDCLQKHNVFITVPVLHSVSLIGHLGAVDAQLMESNDPHVGVGILRTPNIPKDLYVGGRSSSTRLPYEHVRFSFEEVE